MRYTLLLTLILIASNSVAQSRSKVTDHDVVKALLGVNLYSINSTLDKLGVWYHFHFKDDKSSKGEDYKPRIYSISNSDEHTKVFIIRYSRELVVDEVMINFRHDDRTQVEDMKRMPAPTEFHVGTYSTDLVYRLK